MDRTRPLLRSSFPDEMTIWLLGAGAAFTLLIRVPSAEGEEEPRFDIVKYEDLLNQDVRKPRGRSEIVKSKLLIQRL